MLYSYGILGIIIIFIIIWGKLGWSKARKEKIRADTAVQHNKFLTETIEDSNELGKKYAEFEKMSRDERTDFMLKSGGLRNEDTDETN